jgi:hypothetical protein
MFGREETLCLVRRGNGVPLPDAVERYQRLPGANGNAYDRYRRSPARYGQVSLGATRVSARKQGRQWTLDYADVELALSGHEERIAERQRVTDDYAAHVLYGGQGASVETGWADTGSAMTSISPRRIMRE